MAHDYLGTEHLLLGVLAQGDTAAAGALRRLGVQPAQVRLETERIVGPGESSGSGDVPLTPLAKRALERATSDAQDAGRELATVEDLLLGLSEMREGLAARILRRLDVSAESIRTELATSGASDPSSGSG